MTLTEFLLARIAEDEALAVPEPAQHQTHLADVIGTWSPRCPTCVQTALGASAGRLLAECEKNRRIIAIAGRGADHTSDDFMANTMAEELLWALALPYADHPDYREEWKP